MSNAPSAEYREHHQVEAPRVDDLAFRQGWRVHTRLRGLKDSGAIDNRQLEAAQTWGRWVEHASGLVTSGWTMRIDRGAPGSGTGPRTAPDGRCPGGCARAPLPWVQNAPRCCAVVVDDLSWSRLAGRLGVGSCSTARKRAVEAIVALAAAPRH